MKKLANLSLVLMAAIVLAGPVLAGEAKTITLQGELQCAKCTLHEEEFEACQNILIVKEDGKESHYYLAKNETNHEYGDVCLKTRVVRVTGQVEEKDGHLWIAASDIATVETEG